MSPQLRRFGRQVVAYLVAMVVLACLGLVGAMLFHTPARAQVGDRQITTWITSWSGTVMDGSLNDKRGCVAGWGSAPDAWRDPRLQTAFAHGERLTGEGQREVSAGVTDASLARLAAARTHPVRLADGSWDPALQPCIDKLQAPAAQWIVAPIASGQRPAYLLNADGTRGKQAGAVATTITGNGQTGPMWCDCRVRSVEATSSTYCPAAIDKQPVGAVPAPVRVTLCRKPS